MKEPSSNALVRQLKVRKHNLLTLLRLPSEALAGSLAQSRYRCGKANCHCAEGEGHSRWSLTFMVDGKKRVQNIPKDWVEFVRERVNEGKAFKQGVAELMAINAQLFRLLNKQDRDNKKRSHRKADD
jgi:hypothetical protein